MKLNKKTLIMVVGLVLSLAVGLGGTLAYLTDTDADVNTMVLGNVQIVQNEQQRVENDKEFTDELEPFENDKPLLPYTDRIGATADEVTIGDYTISLSDKYNNYIDKIVTVTNTGNSDAYVRTLVALPTGGTEHWRQYDAAADVWLHWNLCGDVKDHWVFEEVTGGENGYMTVDGIEYEVWQFTLKEPLAPGKTTYPVIRGLFMDKRVDVNDGKYFMTVNGENYPIENFADAEGKVDVLVLSQAVQAQGFADAATALNEAFPVENAAVMTAWFSDWDEDDIGSPGDKNKTNNPPTDADHWDGTVDTSWYNETDTEFVLTTAEQFAGLSQIVADGVFFEGKTVKLGDNICLSCADGCAAADQLFTPIGDGSNTGFLGTFDGQNHTIYNLRQDCNAKYVGLFGCVENATIKNLVMDGALIESDGRGYAAVIASCGMASTFENITLKNCDVRNYNHNTAGIIGWLYGSENSTFDGINIEDTTTIASWWGSYDTRVGGIVGAMDTTATNTVTIKNSNIACRLDVYNDVCANYQWYNYRMAGMLVADVRDNVTVEGRTQADPKRITCENVTVTFGDWANYHYCEDADYGTPSYAGEGEYKFNRVEAGAGYGGIDLSKCDHDENEQHNVLIAFDFLFGARDGKGVYGVSSHEGVTVVGPNK